MGEYIFGFYLLKDCIGRAMAGGYKTKTIFVLLAICAISAHNNYVCDVQGGCPDPAEATEMTTSMLQLKGQKANMSEEEEEQHARRRELLLELDL